MHHPLGLDTLRSSTSVEDERLLQADALGSLGRVDGSVCSGGFPETSSSYSIGPRTVSVFPVPRAVEVPFLFPSTRQLCM